MPPPTSIHSFTHSSKELTRLALQQGQSLHPDDSYQATLSALEILQNSSFSMFDESTLKQLEQGRTCISTITNQKVDCPPSRKPIDILEDSFSKTQLPPNHDFNGHIGKWDVVSPTDWKVNDFWPDVGLRIVNNATGVAATAINAVSNLAGTVLFDVPAEVDDLSKKYLNVGLDEITVAAQMSTPIPADDLVMGALSELAHISRARKVAGPLAAEIRFVEKSVETTKKIQGGVQESAVLEKILVHTPSPLEHQTVHIFSDKASLKDFFVGAHKIAAKNFFRAATSKSRDFKIIESGNVRLEFFSPADNAGYGKLYVHIMDADGKRLVEFRQALGPEGVINTKFTKKTGDK